MITYRRESRKIIAIDPSLSCSGWALFCCAAQALEAVGTLVPPGPALSLPRRMEKLQQGIDRLLSELQLSENDILVCEGPAPLVRNPLSALKVEGVRGLFEVLARRRGLVVPGRINPRTIQSELLGMRGRQLPRAQVKDWARETAMRLYGPELEDLLGGAASGGSQKKVRISQDIIDAVLLGNFVLTRLNLAAATGEDIETTLQPRSSSRALNGRKRTGTWGAGGLS